MDRCFHHEKFCDGKCFTIVDEQNFSIDSYIKKYVYEGDEKFIPSLENDYVYFEDGVDFCISREDDASYTVYTNDSGFLNLTNSAIPVEISPQKLQACEEAKQHGAAARR